MKMRDKDTIRRFILDKLWDVTCYEISCIAEEHEGECAFSMTEFFTGELERIEKLFNYPEYPEKLNAENNGK